MLNVKSMTSHLQLDPQVVVTPCLRWDVQAQFICTILHLLSMYRMERRSEAVLVLRCGVIFFPF